MSSVLAKYCKASMDANFIHRYWPCIKSIHMTRAIFAVDKQLLAKLRRKTGFTIINCKKALELHDNNIEKAESWLQEVAQEQGWAKATKLSGRTTAQGLIGVHVEANSGSLVELNCETDFVARNEKFKALVSEVSKECVATTVLPSDTGKDLVKEHFSSEQLSDLHTSSGKKLSDLISLAIGNIGENMRLSRALRLQAGGGVKLVGYSHPNSPDEDYQVGRFGAILAYKSEEEQSEVARQLCAHVVGMKPQAVGSPSDPKAPSSDDETLLVHQEFLSDPELTVGEVLEKENITVVDFVRFECGELQRDV